MFGYGWVITTKGLTRHKVLATEENPTHHAIQLVNALSDLPNALLKEENPDPARALIQNAVHPNFVHVPRYPSSHA